MNCRRAILLIFSALVLTFSLMGCGDSTRTGSLNLSEIPKDLQEQYERCPELEDFVANYATEHTKHHNTRCV